MPWSRSPQGTEHVAAQLDWGKIVLRRGAQARHLDSKQPATILGSVGRHEIGMRELSSWINTARLARIHPPSAGRVLLPEWSI